MKNLLKNPNTLLIALGLVLAAAAICLGTMWRDTKPYTSVIYVSESDKASLIEKGVAESVVINLNTATVQELCKLDGVGESLAEAIVEYREELGGFTEVSELADIKGIGDKKLKAIEPYVKVE